MLCHKASTNHPEDDIVVQGYIEYLRQALHLIVESLENYSTAYEALDGMRGMLPRDVLVCSSLADIDERSANPTVTAL